MRRSRSFQVSLVVLGLVCLPTRLRAADDASPTTIYRDEFGIPHIFAPTLEDASFAVGYAQAEDRLEELLMNYRRASGTMAEVFGPSAFQDDLRQRAMRHAEISDARFAEISPKMRAVISSYQNGIRQFMKEHPRAGSRLGPGDFTRGTSWRWAVHHLELADGRGGRRPGTGGCRVRSRCLTAVPTRCSLALDARP